ncbi:MAG: hypothetical protein JXR96_04315 [Deltaproteobacteria bacterium]|nr:hypothetical protein [Deltaproteobacteria bacterium]
MPGIHLFEYDGRHVTIRLFTEKAWMWKTPDDVYKLKSRWKGDELYYLPPFADWQHLATFEKGRFVIRDTNRGREWAFERIRKEDLGPGDRAFVMARDPHDYGIKPTDPYVPGHLRHFPGLYVRKGDRIADAPPADVAVARGYPLFAAKGPAKNGIRLTIMTAKLEVAVGEEVRVIHVLEAFEPGREVYVMGPKTVFEEYVDGELATQRYAGPGVYDGAVMKSPWADYNYEITSYRFSKPGRHTIQWRGGDPSGESVGMQSNVLTISVR